MEDGGPHIHPYHSFEMREACMPRLLEVDENIWGLLYPYYWWKKTAVKKNHPFEAKEEEGRDRALN